MKAGAHALLFLVSLLAQLGFDPASFGAQGATLFEERSPAVMQMIERAIEGAHIADRKVGTCGQAPSDYPEFAARLVALGIDSISLNPGTLIRTERRVAALEETGGDQ